MNLYEIIKNELNAKSEKWNIREKIDYIYIRTLQILKHDSRWLLSKDQNLKDYLFDRELNIFNLEDDKVICSSWSKLFCDLLNVIFTTEDGFDIALPEGNTAPHMFARVYLLDGNVIEYDPLEKTNDFAFAKVNMEIKGIKERRTEEEKERIYRRIGYVRRDIELTEEELEILNKDKIIIEEVLEIFLKKIDYKNLSITELYSVIREQYRKKTGYLLIDLNTKIISTFIKKPVQYIKEV